MINATNLTNSPFTELLSPYTHSIIGYGFFGIVFIFIVAAVYIKTQNLTSTSAVMLLVSALFSSLLTLTQASVVVLTMFYIFTALAMVALIGSIVLSREV